MAVETLIKDNQVVVAGEISTRHYFNLENIVRQVVEPLGMKNVRVTNLLGLQSADIAQGVDNGGAGDRGMMFGYATDETPEYLPLPYVLATRVLEKLMSLGHPLLGKDAKAQVSYDYKKKRIDTFLVSIQHTETADLAKVKRIVTEAMMAVALRYRQNLDFKVLVNPTGRFVLGGSFADAGVTGRKLWQIPMVVSHIMVAVLSLEKTQARLTAQPHTWHERLQRTLFVKAMRNDVKYN